MNDNPDSSIFTSEEQTDMFGDFTTSSEWTGVFLMDGFQDTKNMNEPILPEGHGSADTKRSSIDEVKGIFCRDEGTDIGSVALFASISSHNDLMNESMIPSPDSSVVDHAGQGNYLMSETRCNPPIQFVQIYADGLPPTTVSTAAATIPVSGPSRTLQAGMTDNPNPSGFEQRNRTYVVPKELDVLCRRGGRSNNHPGNHLYLNLISAIQPNYLAAARRDTTAISQKVVDFVHSYKGRFLKLEEGTTDKWYVISNTQARKKASQALREDPSKKAAPKRENQALGDVNTSENQKRKREKSTVVSQMKK